MKSAGTNLARVLFNNAQEGIIIMDMCGNIISCNRSATNITGYTLNSIKGKHLNYFNSSRHSSNFYKGILNNVIKHGFWEGETWKRMKNGNEIPVFNKISLVEDDSLPIHKKYIVSLFQDNSQVYHAEEKIKYVADHDSLTGMMNRDMMIRVAKDMIVESYVENGKTAFIFMDLDGFKKLNDSFGHVVGDAIIQEAADRLDANVSRARTARISGDEFFILFNYQKDEELDKIIAQIFSCFEKAFVIEKHEVYLTTSLGLSIYPDDGDEPHILVQNADTAMFNVKLSGKNNWMKYDRWMTENVNEKIQIELSIRKGLEQGEFVLFYQPKVDLKTGLVTSSEALIRWYHKGTMISPGVFIPVAEETGFINHLGEWVIKESCRQIAEWDAHGSYIKKVAINISGEQFAVTDIFKIVMDACVANKIQPHRLEIEVTESVFMNNYEKAVNQLERLREAGCTIAIDDFGTGYSSLGRLYKLPVDRLKIDRAFVKDLEKDLESHTIVNTIINMTKALNTKVTAEGIETEGQAAVLRELDCQEGQGFLYGKPMTAHKFESLINKNL